MKIRNYVFILLIFEILMISLTLTIISPQNDRSVLENRTLEKFDNLLSESYFDKNFQTRLENAIADQFISRNDVVLFNKNIDKEFRSIAIDFIATIETPKKDITIDEPKKDPIGEDPKTEPDPEPVIDMNVYYVGDIVSQVGKDASRYIYNVVEKNHVYDDYLRRSAEDINKYKAFGLEIMILNIPYSGDMNFFDNVSSDSEQYINEFQTLLADGVLYNYLGLESYEDFNKYFYKTDQHPTNKGIEYFYNEIFEYMKAQDYIDVDTRKHQIREYRCFDVQFYGTYTRRVGELNGLYDKFCADVYDVPEYKTYGLDGSEILYGSRDRYLNLNYSQQDKGFSYYHDYFGINLEMVQYVFDNPDKENIMIMSDSNSNGLNELIASNFKNTFVVDPRFNEDFNYKFDILAFIRREKITRVVYVMDTVHLMFDPRYWKLD